MQFNGANTARTVATDSAMKEGDEGGQKEGNEGKMEQEEDLLSFLSFICFHIFLPAFLRNEHRRSIHFSSCRPPTGPHDPE